MSAQPATPTGPVEPLRAQSDVARRAVVTGAILLAGGTAVAGCGGSSGADAAGSSSAAPGGVIVKLADVPVGSAVSAEVSGKRVIVAQPTKGKVVAFSAVCTHQGCTVSPAGAMLNCPCHGSVFDALTGKNLSGPAPSPLPPVPVKLNAAGDGVVAG